MFGPAIMVNPVTRSIAGEPVASPSSQWIDQAGQPGTLTGTYYQGKNFEQEKLERRDPAISFDWKNSPDPRLQRTDFSVRWEGSLLTQKAGNYTFTMQADDGMRLWIDGKLVIDDWIAQAVTTRTAVVNLPANSRVPIKIGYFQDQFDACVDLKWTPPHDPAGSFTRAVYLPAATSWIDFWTGETLPGGQTVQARAPIETMPLYVRAGSILPYGPGIQYATQKMDPLELRVYRGADGAFTLYEDENDNYDYEKGVYATIPLSWSEKDQVLTIGKRQGQFPGMLKTRTFRIVWVSPGHGTGIPLTPSPDAEITYQGQSIRVPFPKK
jgi:alpha-D-xyloside xylohydrolase